MPLFPMKYTLIRTSAGGYVNGDYVPGIEQSSLVDFDIQPIISDETQSLDEGRREIGRIKIYSDIDLITNEEGQNTIADRVVYEGKTYEVIKEDKRRVTILRHNKYTAELRR